MSNTTSPPLYRNDLWTLENENDSGLGLGGAGAQVARMALEVDAPFAIGVTGKWGAGKTSVMRQAFITLGGKPIRQELILAAPRSEEHNEDWEQTGEALRKKNLKKEYHDIESILCVWYSPWQHQSEGNPLVPLVQEIKAQFLARLTPLKKGQRRAVMAGKRNVGLASIKLLEHLTDAALSLTMQRPVSLARGMSDSLRQAWQESNPEPLAPSDGQRFHLLFEDTIEEVLKAISPRSAKNIYHARLVIFIDDLDRCEESVIVHLLEAIKLYLGSRHCVFVLGLDDGAVMDALKRHWEKRSEDSNREYLEKLFQATLAIPLPTCKEVRSFIAEQLQRHQIPWSESEPDPEAARRQLAQDIDALLEPNPRKIKNFVNSLCATWEMHRMSAWIRAANPSDGCAQEARRFLLFHYLRQYHRPVWRLLERQPWALPLLWAVLNDNAPLTELQNLSGTDVDREDQRLLEEIFFRAFSHVLKHPSLNERERQDKHGRESLEQAVESFQQRRDRKRSDEEFKRLFKELICNTTKLHDGYLYLTAPTPREDSA